MAEEWKWISGFEGKYQVSNMGRVKSFCFDKSGKIMSAKRTDGSYVSVALRKDKKYFRKHVHSLVAEMFIGIRPEGYEIHHRDEDKQNNTLPNLVYVPRNEHKKITNKCNPQLGEKLGKYVLDNSSKPVSQLTMSGDLVKVYPSCKEAERRTGVNASAIVKVATGKEYKPGKKRTQAGGYMWKYIEETNK